MHSTVVCFTSADGERDIISADDLFEEIRHVADYTMPIADDDMYAIAKSMMGKISKDIVQNNDKTVTVKFDMGKIQELLENEITRYKNLVDGFSLDEYKEDWILLYRLKNGLFDPYDAMFRDVDNGYPMNWLEQLFELWHSGRDEILITQMFDFHS